MTPEQQKLAYELITYPPRGSALERAKRWGANLRALVDNLCLTHTERAPKWSRQVNLMIDRAKRKQLRKTARKKKSVAPTLSPLKKGSDPT